MTAEALPQRSGVASVISYRLGGRESPMVSVGSCKVCQSPQRIKIESDIIAGRTWGMIEKSIKVVDPDCDLTGRNIRDHYHNGHLPLEQEAGRRIIERRATQRGADIEKGLDKFPGFRGDPDYSMDQHLFPLAKRQGCQRTLHMRRRRVRVDTFPVEDAFFRRI